MMSSKTVSARSLAARTTVLAAAVLLAACGAKKEATPATQVAAKVNDTEITVHQINYRLQQERGLKPEQMEEASNKVLEKLVEQELAIQKAEQLKLDRDPRIMQALDAARREVLSRAYLEQVAQGVSAPAEDGLRRYYEDNPALFSARRIYAVTDVRTETPAAQLPELQALVAAGKSLADVQAWLKSHDIKTDVKSGVTPAENIPLNVLKVLSGLQEGRGMVVLDRNITRLMFVTGSRPGPVTFEQAKPAIAQFLLNDARRKVLDSNLKALRTSAKIEYLGKFAPLAEAQAKLGTSNTVDPTAQVAAASGVTVALPTSTASGVTVSLPGAAASSSGVTISLPASAAAERVQVSLPGNAASSAGVQVKLPGTTVDTEAAKKGLGLK